MADASATVVVLNPVSGGGEATPEIRERAHRRGFRLEETEAKGDGVDLARRAVEEGADRVVAAGGDGTINEVVQGLADADALGEVTLGVVPGGTGNNFAGNVGVEGVEQAFELFDDGPVRRIDLGTADGRVFANSCVAGLTAEASEETDSELKGRWGAFAYVITTLRTLQEFDPLPLAVEAYTPDGGEQRWTGEAAVVLVGNARRFQVGGRSQAHVEDGLLEVLIVEQQPPADLLGDAALGELFGAGAEGLRRLRTPALDVSVHGEEAVDFSFDGEIESRTELSLAARRGALSVHVGPAYEPDPDAVDDGDGGWGDVLERSAGPDDASG